MICKTLKHKNLIRKTPKANLHDLTHADSLFLALYAKRMSGRHSLTLLNSQVMKHASIFHRYSEAADYHPFGPLNPQIEQGSDDVWIP